MQDQARQQSVVSSPKHSSLTKPVRYTVFVRLPFPRNDFVDPPLVEWDTVKDKALWKIISKGSDTRDLNWQDIAARFDVSLDFLMQQAAWLYERHFAGVRKQMQRLASTAGPASTPTTRQQSVSDASGPATSILQRTASKGSRAPSSLSIRRDAPSHVADQHTTPTTPRLTAPPFSRTPSSATITQSRLFTSAQTVAQQSFRRPYVSSQTSRPPNVDGLTTSQESDSGDETQSILAHSQAFRRPPLSKKSTLGTLASDGDAEDDDDDDEDDDQNSSAGYLPFATIGRHDPEATLRDASLSKSSRSKATDQAPPIQTVTSPASSTSSNIPTQSTDASSKVISRTQKPGPLSPKHRAQLAQLSSRAAGAEGSEGTPSMGSSFSDLDDAGISASAIEDAVLSMQTGGASIASRVSGLSQAFRSNRS